MGLTPAGSATRRAPALELDMNEMDERFLWQMIELAWKKAERAYAERA